MKKNQSIKQQLRKGILEYAVLLIVSKKAVYSSDILDKLSNIDLITTEGTIYPLLNRLNKQKLLSYFWKESSEGSPRKYYELTPQGKKFLAQYEKVWERISKSINLLKN
jgi:PadR family transcriptional regulator PadR